MTLFPCSARSATLAGLLLLGTSDARHNPRKNLEDIDQLPTLALVGGGVSLRVLPLGDAVTYGYPEAPNSYREALRELLVADGNPVDMVGSATAGDMADNQVEASPAGGTIDELSERAKAAISKFRPNLVLINAGAEDCRQGLETGDAAERILEVMQYSWSESVASSVVLSTVLAPSGGGDEAIGACVEGVNQLIRELVEAQQALSRKVVLVDFGSEGGITPEDVDEDGFPSMEGYARMAKMWFDGIDDAGSRGWLEAPEPLPKETPESGDEPESSLTSTSTATTTATATATATTTASGVASTPALETAPELSDIGKPSAAGEVSSDPEREAPEGVASRVGGSGLALVVAAVVAMVMGV